MEGGAKERGREGGRERGGEEGRGGEERVERGGPKDRMVRVCNNYGVHGTSAVPVQYKHVLVEQVRKYRRNIIIKRTDRRAKGKLPPWAGTVKVVWSCKYNMANSLLYGT